MGINFLSFPNEVQFMIYTKMENLEIMKMSASCSFADRFVQRHKKYLNSRIHMGESVVLEATKVGIAIRKEVWTEKSMNKRMHFVDEDFFKNIAPIAIRKLQIDVKDPGSVDIVWAILNRWQPICQTATIYGNIPSNFLIEMEYCIRFSGQIELQCPKENGSELFSNLARVRTPEKHKLILSPYAKYDNLLEKTREFGSFSGQFYAVEVVNFVSELNDSKNTGNLRQGTFTVLCGRAQSMKFPFLLVFPGLPEATVLFTTCSSEASKSGARCVLKLPLNDGNCALICESNSTNPLAKIIDVLIVRDDEDYIMSVLIKLLGIDKSQFPNEARKTFFSMGNEQRIFELQLAYTMSQDLRRLRNRIYIVPSHILLPITTA